MKPIDDWKRAWRYFSVQANTIGVALCSTYGAMYEQVKETVPPKYMAMLTAAVFLAGIVGRVIAQGSPPAPPALETEPAMPKSEPAVRRKKKGAP